MKPIQLTVVYLIFSLLWMFFSDFLVEFLESSGWFSNEEMRWVQSSKGVAFVLFTGFLIFQLSKRNEEKTKGVVKKLRAQKKYIDVLFSRSDLSIFILNVDGTFRRINENFAKFLGYKSKELKGINFFDLVIPESDKELREARKGLLKREFDTFNIAVCLERKDNSVAHLRIIGIGLYNEKDQLDIVVASGMDITEERLLQQQLMETRNNLKTLINNSPDIIWSVDTDLKLVAYNDKYEKMIFRETATEVNPGDDAMMGNSPLLSSKKKWKSYYEKAFDGKSFTIQEADNAHDGIKVMEIFISPIYDSSQNVIGASCCATDITGRIITDHEKRKAIVEGQENERQNISKVLHDGVVQTLAAVKMNCNVLKNKLEREEVSIEKAIQYSANAIEQLRDLSRDLHPPELNGGFIQGIRSYFHRLNNAEEQMEFELEIDLCEDENHLYEKLNPLNVYRIIQESVNNAVKYSEASRVRLKIYCEDKGNGERKLVLEIADNGKGFDPDKVGEEGVGLKNMRNRAELEMMEFNIDSDGSGTRIRLTKMLGII